MQSIEENTYSTCIFLNTKNRYDIYRFENVLSPSAKFLDNKILVVNEYSDFLNKYKDYKIILDKDIFPHSFSNYRKQMMLKLYVSKYINTSHYLILDSDIYINKQFDFKDFFTDGKIVFSLFDALGGFFDIKNYDKCNQTKWIFDTIPLHNKKIEDIKRPLCYGVTPALLVTDEVKNLISYLENEFGDFVDFFENNDNCGSEYSNYYTYVNDKDLYKLDKSKEHFVNAIWSADQPLSSLNKNSYFWVIQSNLRIDNNYILEFIKNEIHNAK